MILKLLLLNDSEIICIPDDGVMNRFYPLKLGFYFILFYFILFYFILFYYLYKRKFTPAQGRCTRRP